MLAPATSLRAVALCPFMAFVLLAAGAASSAATAASGPRLGVYFLQGEQLRPVNRPGRTARDAVRQLIAGPTRAERHRGFRTYVPARTRIRRVTVAHGLATVDLTGAFLNHRRNHDSMLARLGELVHTLTGVQGTKRVQLLVDGATTEG